MKLLLDILSEIDWAVALTVAVMAITAIATMLIWRSNVLANRIAVGEIMPILNFRVDRKEAPAWIVENVGKGVALNVRIVHETQDGKLEEPIRDYNALRPQKYYRIIWKHKPLKFVAQYTDVYKQPYTAVCAHNTNSIHKGWLYKDWDEKEIRPIWRMAFAGEIDPVEDIQPKEN